MHPLKLIEVPDERAPESYSILEMQGIKMREGEKILSHISKGAYVIAFLRHPGRKNEYRGFKKKD